MKVRFNLALAFSKCNLSSLVYSTKHSILGRESLGERELRNISPKAYELLASST